VTAPRTAADWIAALALTPHPEGGHYRETYRAAASVPTPAGPRAASTAIYFLLQAREISALHRIRSDELWHFHAGEALEIVELSEAGSREHRLGLDVGHGESPQVSIPAGVWFGARVAGGAGFAVVSCTVAPGFDFADFELGDRAALRARHPRHAALIETFTRPC
jgi:uncharacterized protein